MKPLELRPCALVPSYNHAQAAHVVVKRLISLNLPVVLVDDGSRPDDARMLQEIARGFGDKVVLVRRPVNGGKGAACLSGFAEAHARGYTHALQVDADAQHDINAAPGFLEAARAQPGALICGCPRYDDSAPAARRWGHKVTNFWVCINTLGKGPADSLCGFRVYPLAETLEVLAHCRIGLRMDFDLDIAVRLAWAGVAVVNRPVRVTYPPGGVSHFKGLRDNAVISLTHARHCTLMILDALHILRHHRLQRRTPTHAQS